MHLVFERRRFAPSLARGDGGGVSGVVEQAGGRKALLLCGSIPVPGAGGGTGGGTGGGARRSGRGRRGGSGVGFRGQGVGREATG